VKRINSRTVEYTEQEMVTVTRFDALLDEGKGIPEAALIALQEMPGHINAAFVRHLSENTVEKVGNRVRYAKGWSPTERAEIDKG
jgi:hypothetical protein